MPKIVIVAPHADDEVLGCGGLLAKLRHKKVISASDKPHVIFGAISSHDHVGDAAMKSTSTARRKYEIEESSKFFNFTYSIAYVGRQWHLRLDTVPQEVLIRKIERELEFLKPEWLFIPWKSNFNQDHRAWSDACYTATRPNPGCYYVPNVLYYDEPNHLVPGAEHVFSPDFFIEITINEMHDVLEGLQLHSSQIRRKPNIRSIENLEAIASIRGSQIAKRYAEGYKVLRMSSGTNLVE